MAEKLRRCGGCGKSIPYSSVCECQRKDSRKRDKEKDKVIHSYKWQRLRDRVVKRDGGICLRCYGKYGVVNSSDLTVHHIKSREHYPELTWDIDNLICICRSCNSELGIRDKLDFTVKLLEEQNNWWD